MILERIPQTANDITIKQYRNLIKEKDYVKQICILTGCSEDEVKNLKKKEVDFAVYVLLKNINDLEIDFNDYTFGEFNFSTSIAEATLNQWTDCVSIMKKYENDYESALPYIMAIYCLKDGEKYDFNKLQERAEYFDERPYIDGLRFTAFFLTSDKNFLNAMINYFPTHPLLTFRQDIARFQESMEDLLHSRD